MTYISHSEEETLSFGYRLGKQCKSGTVISLRGGWEREKPFLPKALHEPWASPNQL